MSRTEPSAPAALTRVVAIEATRVRLPATPARARATGRQSARPSEHIAVRVSDETGISGWGEITIGTDPEGAGTALHLWRSLLEEMGPALLGYTWRRPTQVPDAFAETAPAAPVQAGLDVACWDLWSRRRDAPLAHSLGGTRTAITAGTTIGAHTSVESLVGEVNRQVGNGFRRLRLRVEPGWDLEPVGAVLDTYPFLVLQVDCGGCYRETPEHLAALRALDELGLLVIEQPFEGGDLAAHARLARELRTPLALGPDSVGTLEALDRAISMEAAGALNLDLSRMGGLTQARRAHDRAADAGWQVWCGSAGESGLGRAARVALASLRGVSLPSEMPGAGSRYGRGRDLVVPAVRAHDGVVPVPLAEPGLGHGVDVETLQARAVESTTLRH